MKSPLKSFGKKRLLLLALMLWLPLQNALATGMSVCVHDANSRNATIHESVASATATATPDLPDHCNTPAPAANDNAPCHDSDACADGSFCHGAATAIFNSTGVLTDAVSRIYSAAPATPITLFVPEQPQRPPLL